MKRFYFSLLPVLIGLAVVGWFFSQPAVAAPPQQDGDKAGELQAVEQAVQAELAQLARFEPALLIASVQVTDTHISQDGEWAVTYLILQHPDTGEVLPNEPGLAFARKVDGNWVATLPDQKGWQALVSTAPEDVLDANAKQYWLEINARYDAELPSAPLTGYLLPWEGGKTVSLSGSVSHDRYITSGTAHYAFDFYVSGQMFPVVAAKTGTVHLIREGQPDYDSTTPGNYIVIKDTTTNTYQLYLHLAHDSVPDDLDVGDLVYRGEYIGMADDTGASSGHHLHFMVHQTSTSYWGQSVDILFGDVGINGGRPRVQDFWYDDEPYCDWPGDVCDQFQSAYVSGNYGDNIPPTGSLTSPANHSVVQAASVSLAGTASDSGSSIKEAHFMAFYGNAWHDIGPSFTTTSFAYTFNLCSAGIPDGPLSLGLRVLDRAGNLNPLADLHHIRKDYACPLTPLPVKACLPGANQVALYATAGWLAACEKFPATDTPLASPALFNSLVTVGDNNTAALLVGSSAQVTLYTAADGQGRGETFTANDGNLEDNLVGADRVSSLVVAARSAPPQIPLPGWPVSPTVVNQTDSHSLYWRNAGQAAEFQARLTRLSDARTITSTWQAETYWLLGTGVDGLVFTPGSYTWQVRARSSSGTSAWSAMQTFTVNPSTLPANTPKTLPFSDNFETDLGWVGSGLWQRIQGVPGHGYQWWWGESVSGNKRYYSAKAGDLTSPLIQIAAPGATLRFSYYYETETTGLHWDQRWVQLSVDNGPFYNLYQLTDDPMTEWMQSPPISLPPTAINRPVRIRFHFDTIDASGASPDNDFDGWYVDDVSITTGAPIGCADVEDGSVLAYNTTPLSGTICGPGDIDLFSFTAVEGEQVTIDVDAYSLDSPLDPFLFVLDVDGTSVLAENDDQRPGYLDPLLKFKAPADGVYTLKVRAWDHGRSGGTDYDYTIGLYTGDTTEPVVSLTTPVTYGYLPGFPLALTANVSESGSGVDRVEFYWHANDWLTDVWEPLPAPTLVGDEWMVVFDPANPLRSEQTGAAIYMVVYDNSGSLAADAAWELVLDKTPPVSALAPLAAVQDSPRFFLNWTASDNLTGLAGFDLQRSLDGGAWSSVQTGIAPALRTLEYIGTPDTLYGFRLRAQDQAGNLEAYPTSAETATLVPAADVLCTTLDSYENDNTVLDANSLEVDGAAQVHNFCNPAGLLNLADYDNDQDWISITVEAGTEYMILATPLHPDAALSVSLFAADGVTLVRAPAAAAYNRPLAIRWIAPTSGTYTLKIAHTDGRILGSAVQYRVKIFEPYIMYLPKVFR